jgi:hypothetical protein
MNVLSHPVTLFLIIKRRDWAPRLNHPLAMDGCLGVCMRSGVCEVRVLEERIDIYRMQRSIPLIR